MDLVLFGIQGSGKGTQATLLARDFGYDIFEAGGALRAIAASGTELGKTVSGYIDHGHLVPFQIIMDVVRDAVSKKPADQKILFDGIPRDLDQMHAFNELMHDLGRSFRCIELTVNEEAAIKRIQGRAQQQGRADDANEEFIRRRIGLFHEKTKPVIEAYKAAGTLTQVNGEGAVEEVYARLKKAIS
jgi:adenylate kinase